MGIHTKRTYLQKHRFIERQILSVPSRNLGIVVVIPTYCEENLLTTLESLEACTSPNKDVEVIVVFNSGVHEDRGIKKQNAIGFKSALAWEKTKKSSISYHFLYFSELPKKHAGVGLARKIGMDEAIDRFEQAENDDGIILCLDADCTVAENYLLEIEAHFKKYPNIQAASIYFEHPLNGTVFSPEIYEGITLYELFLRYYIEGLRFAGHPYAFHTVGSSMAVRVKGYQQQGGMNRRKAGEDFYFLQKFIELDQLNEVNYTAVYPSPRPAENVPFGTGRAIKQWLDQENNIYLAYSFSIFEDLKKFIDQIPRFYEEDSVNLPESIKTFLLEEQFFTKHLIEIRQHVSSIEAFVKRFFRWFNALKVLKYVHFARDRFFPSENIMKASERLIDINTKKEITISPRSYLTYFRRLQNRNQITSI